MSKARRGKRISARRSRIAHLASPHIAPNRGSLIRALGFECLEGRLLLAADFGDAPLPYPTLLAENGARHEAIGPTLGSLRDTEADGAHSAAADADGADEDGVTFGTIRVGQLGATATVNVQNAPSGAKLDAWIDFDGDGNWGGPMEHIADSVTVANGDNIITFDVPSSAEDGVAFARFRVSTVGNLAVSGAAADGEVEDYGVAIEPPAVASGVFGGQNLVTTFSDGALSVHAADMDGDGDMDVISAEPNFSQDLIRWYDNDGAGGFTIRTIGTPSFSNGLLSVHAADVDGDGDLDVLLATQSRDEIAWYENDGTPAVGVWTVRTITTAADGARSVYAADVDGDGDIDVLSASENDSEIAWYENDGTPANGGWISRTIGTTANGARSVYAVDVDSDGDVDVLSASAADNKIAWYENDGTPAVGAWTARSITTAANGAVDVFAADVDGDGDLDVLSASANDGTIAWHENDGTPAVGSWIARTITTGASGTVYAADMDGDGDTDVLSTANDVTAWI